MEESMFLADAQELLKAINALFSTHFYKASTSDLVYFLEQHDKFMKIWDVFHHKYNALFDQPAMQEVLREIRRLNGEPNQPKE